MKHLFRSVPSISSNSYVEGMRQIFSTAFVNRLFRQSKSQTLYSIGNEKILDCATGAYLGLNHDIRNEDVLLAKNFGIRNGWSRISGTTSLLYELEELLAKSLGLDECRVSQSISLINLTAFSSLKMAFGNVIMDEDAHVTMKKGLKASGIPKDRYSFFENNSIHSLRSRLNSIDNTEPVLVAIDGVYSMKGTFAPVKEITSLCSDYNAYLYVDDAHGFGVLGQNGYGALEELSPELKQRVIYVGSFSKSCSSPIAFIAYPKALSKVVNQSMECLIFSGPPANLIGAIAKRHLSNFKTQEYATLRERLKEISKEIHNALDDLNVDYFSEKESPIISIRILPNNLNMISEVLSKSIFLKPAIFPIVQKGDEIIRLTISSTFTDHDIKQITEGLKRVRQYLKPKRN